MTAYVQTPAASLVTVGDELPSARLLPEGFPFLLTGDSQSVHVVVKGAQAGTGGDSFIGTEGDSLNGQPLSQTPDSTWTVFGDDMIYGSGTALHGGNPLEDVQAQAVVSGSIESGMSADITIQIQAPNPSKDYDNSVFSSGTIRYWKLNEDVGATTFVDSASGDDMTIGDGAPIIGTVGMFYDKQVTLDGTADYFVSSDAFTFDEVVGNWSFDGIITPDPGSTADTHPVFSARGSTPGVDYTYDTRVSTDNLHAIAGNGLIWLELDMDADVTIDGPTHWANTFAYDGVNTAWTFYLAGEVVASGTFVGQAKPMRDECLRFIGWSGQDPGADFFAGDLQRLSFYDQTLDPTGIAYRAGLVTQFNTNPMPEFFFTFGVLGTRCNVFMNQDASMDNPTFTCQIKNHLGATKFLGMDTIPMEDSTTLAITLGVTNDGTFGWSATGFQDDANTSGTDFTGVAPTAPGVSFAISATQGRDMPVQYSNLIFNTLGGSHWQPA